MIWFGSLFLRHFLWHMNEVVTTAFVMRSYDVFKIDIFRFSYQFIRAIAIDRHERWLHPKLKVKSPPACQSEQAQRDWNGLGQRVFILISTLRNRERFSLWTYAPMTNVLQQQRKMVCYITNSISKKSSANKSF